MSPGPWTAHRSDVHLHFLVTEGRVDAAGVFHKIPGIDDARLAELFSREVLRLLVGRKLLSPEWAERIFSWPHSDFNVHSLVRAKTKPEAERVGKDMLRLSSYFHRILPKPESGNENWGYFLDFEIEWGLQMPSPKACIRL